MPSFVILYNLLGTIPLGLLPSPVSVLISRGRLGALEMAVGNVVGSNLFNMGVIIFVDDLFYASGPILRGVDMNHIVTALFAVLMSSIVIVGIIFRPRFWLRIWVGVAFTSVFQRRPVTKVNFSVWPGNLDTLFIEGLLQPET